jgi:serine/threonine protein phosphatase 1
MEILMRWLCDIGCHRVETQPSKATARLAFPKQIWSGSRVYRPISTWGIHFAGVDPFRSLDKQNNDQFCWIREKFFSNQFPYFPDKIIITGHTITFTLPGVRPGEIAQGPGWLNIETGAYHRKSGWMTALDITNAMVYQVNVFSGKKRKQPLDRVVKVVEPSRVKFQ